MNIFTSAVASIPRVVNVVAGAASSHPYTAASVGAAATGFASFGAYKATAPVIRRLPRALRIARAAVRLKLHDWASEPTVQDASDPTSPTPAAAGVMPMAAAA